MNENNLKGCVANELYNHFENLTKLFTDKELEILLEKHPFVFTLMQDFNFIEDDRIEICIAANNLLYKYLDTKIRYELNIENE